MLNHFLQGFALGLAYVAPIGMQNLYVINTAIGKTRKKAYQVAFITSFFDITLALACFYGIGILLDRFYALKLTMLTVGCLAILYIGIGLIRSKPQLKEIDINRSLSQVITTCFTVTWINPQALIDGTLLLGGFRASLPPVASNVFILGVCLASLSWFTGVTTIVSVFRNNIGSRVIRGINILCGAAIIYFGLKLGFSLLKMVHWL